MECPCEIGSEVIVCSLLVDFQTEYTGLQGQQSWTTILPLGQKSLFGLDLAWVGWLEWNFDVLFCTNTLHGYLSQEMIKKLKFVTGFHCTDLLIS